MSESEKEKERIRQELKNAKEELLKRAQQNTKKFAHENNEFKHPDLIRKQKSNKVNTKSKKSKKNMKTRNERMSKKKNNRRMSSSTDSSDTEEEIPKKRRKKRNMSSESSESSSSSSLSSSSSSSSSSSEIENEWVEKVEKVEKPAPIVREDWMNGLMSLKTYSKNDNKIVKEKQQLDAYDPGKSTRELNPYWKNGGTGMPIFQKPRDDDDEKDYNKLNYTYPKNVATGAWRKQKEQTIPSEKSLSLNTSSIVTETVRNKKIQAEPTFSTSVFLTDQQMNELGAKIIKAEIMGNTELADDLKKKLEDARAMRKQTKNIEKTKKNNTDEHILLTTTDSKGSTRPLLHRAENENDHYGGRRGKQKNKKIETHVSGERVRYFPDDDKYDLKKMFQEEKYTTAADSDAQFAEIAGKHKNPKDDLEDIFADKVRRNITDYEKASKEKQRAIYEHERMEKMLDNCDKCFDSEKINKQLIVSMGNNAYLALPWHEGLQPKHCLIIPLQHIACSTLLDEDTWEEITDYRKALTKMFAAHKQDVVFFETVRNLHKRPHMMIHCVPLGSIEMAPFFFKKAIQESEYEWSTNKQLMSLKEKGLRRTIPKGLPYFWVNFGMDTGFAHVIEDVERFPSNFAQEIIGGMLNLDPRKWRRPRKEANSISMVKQFSDWWNPFDFKNPN